MALPATQLPPDLATVIAAQSGMVARWQARQHGLSQAAIRYRINAGRWRRAHRGVYATFTGPLSRNAQLWAAVLYCSQEKSTTTTTTDGSEAAGPRSVDAVLSHETAAELYGLVDRPAPLIHVTIRDGRRLPKPVRGIRVHISTRLDQTRHPARTPPRTRLEDTMIDLTQTAPTLDTAVDWLSIACGKRLTTPKRLAARLRARPKVRWRAELRYALGDVAEGDHSPLELRYHRVERAHGLPWAQRQFRRVEDLTGKVQYDDVVYEEFATIVHLDGRVHLRIGHRVRDMRRDNLTVIRDEDPLRYGWDDLDEDPCQVAAQVVFILARNGWTGTPKLCGPTCTMVLYLDHWREWAKQQLLSPVINDVGRFLAGDGIGASLQETVGKSSSSASGGTPVDEDQRPIDD